MRAVNKNKERDLNKNYPVSLLPKKAFELGVDMDPELRLGFDAGTG
jgi:hypothetical protein